MNILVVNAGSSSIKYQVIDPKTEISLIKGMVEKIGEPGSRLRQTVKGAQPVDIARDAKDFSQAIEVIKNALLEENVNIDAVGHRVVHGGEEFSSSILVTESEINRIDKYSELAPLHNPANIAGIRACQKLFPGVPQAAVFDTSFHCTMPKNAYLYAIPYEYYEQNKIRRYGFHGTSHRYVSMRAAEILKKDIKKINLITCHLGNGASITAVEKGRSVDTSMGFTPLEGVIMGTRCGDIDPAVVFYLMEKKDLSVGKINDLLNKKSGLLGISGISNDVRILKQAAEGGNERAKIALEMYVYKIEKYIGAFITAMNGVNAIVFTAGVGENNPFVRTSIANKLAFFGVKIDEKLNTSDKKEKIISKKGSPIEILVVPTNEELMIARDTFSLILN